MNADVSAKLSASIPRRTGRPRDADFQSSCNHLAIISQSSRNHLGCQFGQDLLLRHRSAALITGPIGDPATLLKIFEQAVEKRRTAEMIERVGAGADIGLGSRSSAERQATKELASLAFVASEDALKYLGVISDRSTALEAVDEDIKA